MCDEYSGAMAFARYACFACFRGSGQADISADGGIGSLKQGIVWAGARRKTNLEVSKFSGRNRSNGENVVPPGGGNFDGAFDMLLTFDLAEIQILLDRDDLPSCLPQEAA
jgi:hypothetical protein